jgi:type III pantothenate kinase
MFRGLLSEHPAPDGVAVCSTVPAVLDQLTAMLDRYFADVPTVVVGPGVRTGVPIHTDNPREVGPDRIVNTLAAHTLYGGPAVVVDFGTSTNFDVVSAKGEFLGGALAPGVEISVDALAARAARLFKVELVEPALGDRQEHQRVPAVRACCTASQVRSTGWCSGSPTSWGSGRWCWPPAGCPT